MGQRGGKTQAQTFREAPHHPRTSEHHPIPYPPLNATATHRYPNHPHASTPRFSQMLIRTPHITNSDTLDGGEEKFLATLLERDFIAFFFFFYLKISRHLELWGVESKKHIQPHKH